MSSPPRPLEIALTIAAPMHPTDLRTRSQQEPGAHPPRLQMEPYALNTTRGALHPFGSGGAPVSGKLGRPRGTVLSTLKRRHAEVMAPELLLHVGDLAYATGYATQCTALHCTLWVCRSGCATHSGLRHCVRGRPLHFAEYLVMLCMALQVRVRMGLLRSADRAAV